MTIERAESISEETRKLRALVVCFVAATDWTDPSNEALRNARNYAAKLVPGVKGNPNFTALANQAAMMLAHDASQEPKS